MVLMLRQILARIIIGIVLTAVPLGSLADTSLTSPSTSASVLQPSPTETIQTGADQNSGASADYLNGELVGGAHSPQADATSAAPSPWGDIIAALLTAIGIIGLVAVLYRSRRKDSSIPEPTPVKKPAAKKKKKKK